MKEWGRGTGLKALWSEFQTASSSATGGNFQASLDSSAASLPNFIFSVYPSFLLVSACRSDHLGTVQTNARSTNPANRTLQLNTFKVNKTPKPVHSVLLLFDFATIPEKLPRQTATFSQLRDWAVIAARPCAASPLWCRELTAGMVQVPWSVGEYGDPELNWEKLLGLSGTFNTRQGTATRLRQRGSAAFWFHSLAINQVFSRANRRCIRSLCFLA